MTSVIIELHPFIIYCLEHNIFSGLTHRLDDKIYSKFLDAGKYIQLNICPYGDTWDLKTLNNDCLIFLYYYYCSATNNYIKDIHHSLLPSFNNCKNKKYIDTIVSINGGLYDITLKGRLKIFLDIKKHNKVTTFLLKIVLFIYNIIVKRRKI